MSLRPILLPLVLIPAPPGAPPATSAILGLRRRLYVLPADPAPSPAPPAGPRLRDLRVGDTEFCDPAQEELADAGADASPSLAAAVEVGACRPQPGPQPERLMLKRRSSSSFTLRDRRLFSSLSFCT